MREMAMTVLRRTWLPTTLFVVASVAAWWKVIGLEATLRHLFPTLLLTPLMWWFIVGRQARPHLVRGVLAGGLTGFVTQSAQDIPDFLSFFAHRGTGTGEDQLVAGVAMAVLLFFGIVATLGGALLGLTTILIQRRLH
jgi:hypothetical protein